MHSELRLALIVVGIVLAIGIFVDTMRRRSEEPKTKKALERWGDDVPTTQKKAAKEPTRAEVFAEQQAEKQHKTEPSYTSHEPIKQVITLGIMATGDDGYGRKAFSGTALLASLKAAGMEFGEDKIFHAYGPFKEESAPWFSVCASSELGTFDLREITMTSFPSVICYMTIPGPFELSDAFDSFINTTSRLAQTLRAKVVDERGNELTLADLEALKGLIIKPEAQTA